MKFKVDKAVFEKFPNLYFFIPVINGFNNNIDDLEIKTRIANMLFDGMGDLKSRFDTNEELMADANTQAFLELFKNFGANNRTFPSHVAMAMRVVEGANIPAINPVVDTYNSLSLKYFTPFGGEDLGEVYGDLVLKLAEGNETYIGIGSTENKSPKPGELIWIDDLDVTCRALNWRQCNRTKITPNSKVGYFIMDGVREEDKQNIENAAKDLVEKITEMLGGVTMVLYLDKDNNEVEYDFQTKQITEEQKLEKVELVGRFEPKAHPPLAEKVEREQKMEKVGTEQKVYIFPVNSVASKIQEKLSEAVREKYGIELNPNEIHLETPADESRGDYASNIALNLTKQLGRNPREIASELAKCEMQSAKGEAQSANSEVLSAICEVEVAGAGFLNFKINKEILKQNVKRLAKNEKVEILGKDKIKRIMVEMGDPNTHKMPHIGHLFSYIAGGSLADILEACGHEIFRVYYGGDVGMHVAKALYGWINQDRPRSEDQYERVKILQAAYQLGSKLYEEEEHRVKINEINKAIYDPNSIIQDDWKETRQWSLDYYLQFEKMLGINIDKHYPESMVWQEGLRIVKENIGKVFEESEGAVIFPGERYGLHSRVFITKMGTPTYEAKDMGLCLIKKQDYDYDLTIIPTATEQDEYFKVVIEAINQALPEIRNKVMHIGFGMVNLKSGKMSSRTGNILSAPELVNIVIEKIQEKVNEREDIGEEEKGEIAKVVGLAAIKYSFLKIGLSKNRSFDLEESVSAEGDSAPYILYSYVRAKSILKDQELNLEADLDTKLESIEEQSLIRILSKYEETLLNSSLNYAPNVICSYLYNLAQRFNNFYSKQPILNVESEEVRQSRLILTQATAIALQNGLKLLGIETVQRM
ncbi:arginine--tRNA ligase [Candidatus Dojkabacteria bacterium]|nr:arginine--tRNA ligase [Candidatus Dojkabacteria bacterium]